MLQYTLTVLCKQRLSCKKSRTNELQESYIEAYFEITLKRELHTNSNSVKDITFENK